MLLACTDVPAIELNDDFAGAVIIHFLELSDVAFKTKYVVSIVAID